MKAVQCSLSCSPQVYKSGGSKKLYPHLQNRGAAPVQSRFVVDAAQISVDGVVDQTDFCFTCNICPVASSGFGATDH